MFIKNKPAVIGLGLIASMLIISILVLSIFGFNRINMISADYQNSAAVDAPSFSHESGFYDNPFYLKINVPKGTTVYYTLDCSDPDTSSFKYTAKSPIYLENATKNKNVYSARTDTSAGFLTDLIKSRKNAGDAPGYVVPKYNVDKCNVVRAVAVTKDGRKSEIVTGSYFVGISATTYDNAKIVSVVTDPDNLFDSKKGIYVLGDKFEEYKKSYYFLSGTGDTLWTLWDANYRQKGKKWQRDASIQIFDCNGRFITSNLGGIRTKGYTSRADAWRSLNFYAKENETINNNIFKNDYNPNKISLSSGRSSVLKDYFITNTVDDLNFSTMRYIPCVLFLDGEFWGMFYLTEKYDEFYISHHYGVEKDNVIIVKEGAIESGDKNNLKYYTSMRNYISTSNMSNSANYKKACELIDINSYIDYYSMMAYIARSNDWPQTNEAAWRTVKVTDGKYADGKWRWMLFDCNSACMTDALIKHNTLQYIVENDAVFASLWNNSSFRASFQKRIFEIADNYFSPEIINKTIENYANQILPLCKKSWMRYLGEYKINENYFSEKKNSYRDFFTYRRAVVESWFDNK